MARRMFSPKIVGSDAFLDMPISTQALYFHLGMEADDDGFVNPKKIMRVIGASEDDIRVLIGKRFVLSFENGVIVIKHWLINNMIRKDFYKETSYLDEKVRLKIKENKSYTENVDKLLTEPTHRIGKVRLGKDNTIAETSSAKEFSFKEEIDKMYDNPRRDINVIALYFEERKPDIKNKEQLQVAIRRHIRPAKDLVPFTDDQILNAITKAKKLTSEWTLETLTKVLTK